MGIHLVMEAAERAPDLTWRERYALLVFASSAMDGTRECPDGIEDRPEIIRRLGLSRTQRYAVIAALCEKGALLRVKRGRNGVKAVYAIAPFVTIPSAERPGDPDVPPVDNRVKGPVNRDATGPLKGPGSENEGSRKPGLKDPSNRDASAGDTVFRGIKGFKTGGGTPPAPRQSPILLPVPDGKPKGEGDHPGSQIRNRDRRALADEISQARDEWSARSVLRALEHPDVAGRPWLIVAEAMRLVAADKATQSPGRLKHEGPWWAEAARRVRAATGAADAARSAHAFDPDPETRLCRVCHAPEVDKSHARRRSA